jgi:hypothetical protein
MAEQDAVIDPGALLVTKKASRSKKNELEAEMNPAKVLLEVLEHATSAEMG